MNWPKRLKKLKNNIFRFNNKMDGKVKIYLDKFDTELVIEEKQFTFQKEINKIKQEFYDLWPPE